MSAYVVEDKVINSVVTYMADSRRAWERRMIETALEEQGTIGETFEEKLGNAMFELNCNAVEQRYGDGEAKEFRDLDYHYSPVYLGSGYAVYDNLGCWIYQCSEGDVPEGRLYQAMERVYNSMAHSFFRDMRDTREERDNDIRRELRQRIDALEAKLKGRRVA